jgi:L-fuconolactonase
MQDAKPTDFGIVDTHCHLWRWELIRKAWQAPAPIDRSFGARDLEAACASSGVKQCVLIEAGSTSEDNKALEGFADSSPLITGIVPYVDLGDPKLDAVLDYWQKRPKFCGTRMGFEGKTDPNLMTGRTTLEGFQKLATRKIPFEFLVTTRDLANIIKVYEQVPGLISVIEHLGKPDILHRTDWKVWSRLMRELANHTRALCKLSLGPRGEDMKYIAAHQQLGWAQDKFKPYMQQLLENFGPERLLWGSDWPLLLLEGGYYDCYQAARMALGPVDRETEVKIFSTTAVKTYRLPSS